MKFIEFLFFRFNKEISQLGCMLGHVVKHLTYLRLHTDGRIFVNEIFHSRDLIDVFLDL